MLAKRTTVAAEEHSFELLNAGGSGLKTACPDLSHLGLQAYDKIVA